MYFEIENTPEHVRRARRKEVVRKDSPKEECPRLILAPFSRPPQMVFENVLIGTSCKRHLEVYNPSKQVQQITLSRALPPGLIIELPREWLEVEPETCYNLTMMWTPMQPTALRETIRFTNENRGKYDVIVVLKSAMNIKGKSNHPKGSKLSPGKIKKRPSKKSPVSVYKKKVEITYNTTKIKKAISMTQSTEHRILKSSNKENISNFNECSMQAYSEKCPFDSPSSIDFNFDTSEIFSNFRRNNDENLLQDTYDKSYKTDLPQNVLKPSNKQLKEDSASDLFDNLTFTPLKTLNAKSEKLDKGPKIILSMNSESELDDSLEVKSSNKENEMHSVVYVTSTQPQNKWLTINHPPHAQMIDQLDETPNIQNKKIPNTSSPKELHSPNFSINTEFSRISDLSFAPPRFSTERKVLPKVNETHELLEEPIKFSSDTYTKDSPNIPVEQYNLMYADQRPSNFYMKDTKMCRQALFTSDLFYSNLRSDVKSPPRSLTPPLQSIPEESIQLSDTQVFEKTDTQTTTFTINRTFDKLPERNSLSSTNRNSWSKKAVRAEPEIWKVPVPLPRKSLKPKAIINNKESLSGKMSGTFENKGICQNISLNTIGNVYSQSFTVDPFMSSAYFYDKEAVDKFEVEFRRWLNYILTPPADLDSNVEQKIDVGKAWLENRNKEVPAAPTKEQVCSVYHNSHRLESLRRAARALLLSPEITQIFKKLNAQIDKKLIAIRNDRNLHLDVGLQKIIMEVLLSYNPLWLRIGLEAIYGLVLPLKSNSDIEGLTLFIIQRMFKNPHLKNKQSKSAAPNMLLPAYMDAIKKFTLKKFFMLVFFLDQAKQKKIISHDPCLFCRNAVCKESREVIIKFTRELIAGIGDITKHLRPLGYIVCHKQSYLDEYKYAVHNIAVDLRDGIRLTKVMEIILMKNGLLNQLRTPAISRLQKIHNVQVALNALKEADFQIVGDITANDIADGHREKTLSLLWQLIRVFRAPLFVKAANIIQTWWRKKYEVIVEKRIDEEKLRQKLNNAASVIQCWWRRIQYNRLVEWQSKQITAATVVVQKYCRKWLCRTRFLKMKYSVLKIEDWYKSVKSIREAKETLESLKKKRLELLRRSSTVLQSYVRRWLCIRRFRESVRKIILIQSAVRCYLQRKQYLQLQKSVVYIQRKYKSKLLMRAEMTKYTAIKKAALTIQSYYKMIKLRRLYGKLKKSVKTIEERYKALLKMKIEQKKYNEIKKSAILIQAWFRGNKSRMNYATKINSILKIQRNLRAHLQMKRDRENFVKLRNAALALQNHVRAFLAMKKAREDYIAQRAGAIVIQQQYRSYCKGKAQRQSFLRLRNSAIVIQTHYRSLLKMWQDKVAFLKKKNAAIVIQKRFRAIVLMRCCQDSYRRMREATVAIQRRYRARMLMRDERSRYLKMKSSCLTIQMAYRAYVLGTQQRQSFLKTREAVISVQRWFRNLRKTKEVKQQFHESRRACLTIQRTYRAYIIARKERQEYLRIRTATVCIQNYYRSYVEMKVLRNQFIQLRAATVKIQRFYKSYQETKHQREKYLRIKSAAKCIQSFYRRYRFAKIIRETYSELKKATLLIQRRYRILCAMRKERYHFLRFKKHTICIQQKFRALTAMREQKNKYWKLRSAALVIQKRFRAHILMKREKMRYNTVRAACITIQRYYRAYVKGKKEREVYLKLKQATVALQRRYRAQITMRECRNTYLSILSATIIIQRRFRAQSQMRLAKSRFQKLCEASKVFQRVYRAKLAGGKQRDEFMKMKSAATSIQRWFRNILEMIKIRTQYIQLRNAAILIQSHYRGNRVRMEIRRQRAAQKIRLWFRSIQKRNECRKKYLTLKKNIVSLQATYRMYVLRKKFLTVKIAAITIQRYYRSYKLTQHCRQQYIQVRRNIITLQSYVRAIIVRQLYLRIRSAALTIQAAYRLKRKQDLIKKLRAEAATCIQKNIRRYLVQSRYQKYRRHVLFLQKIWKGKLVTRLMRCEYLQKRNIIVRLQAAARGYLVRKKVQIKKKEMRKIREEQRREWAASKLQALFRGHKVRVAVTADRRVAELRRRWREGALESTQESLKERNEEAMEVLRNMYDIETVIRAFRSLELLTEVFPMMYTSNASSIVSRVYIYMSVMNRSISSVEVLMSAASVLVNLTRYRITGPKVYARDRIPPILKFMLRFSNSETQLFCILCTYLWLFSKYHDVKEDLTEYLHIPEHNKTLATIKNNVERMKRMASNARSKFHTPQSTKFISHTGNRSCSKKGNNSQGLLPSLEPDYGIVRAEKPRYFEDAHHAIASLFSAYNL